MNQPFSDLSVTPFCLDRLEDRLLLSSETVDLVSPLEAAALADPTLSLPATLIAPYRLAGEVAQSEAAADSTAALSPPVSGSTPYGAGIWDGTEFMLGDVWVTVVLLESSGATDASTENWTAQQITNVKNEIQAGLTWWEDALVAAGGGDKQDLTFHIDWTYADSPVATAYEPIKRPYSDQSLWIREFLRVVGYDFDSNYMANVAQYNHAQRLANGTHWAYTVFVANSYVDTDGMFSDGYFAYAYLGGPFAVMTYDNDGWGISNMDMVLAHETGHIFYALDEYPGSNSYTDSSGYYDIQNLNAYDDHPNPSTRVASMMAESNLQMTAFANLTSSPTSLEMIGWRDSDDDGILDVLDVPLILAGGGSYNVGTRQYSFSGTSEAGTLTNQNPLWDPVWLNDITLNTVDRLQYRLDGGEWTDLANYAAYDTAVAGDVEIYRNGTYTIEFRTVSLETGVVSNTISDTFLVDLPVSAAPTGVDLAASSDSGAFDDDNITSNDDSQADKRLQFTVNGTIAGASVSLWCDGVEIASTVAAGGTVTLQTPGDLDLGDGPHSFTARQVESGKAESLDSAALTVTVSTQPPQAVLAANDLTTAGGAWYDFTVTFTHPYGIWAGSLGDGNVRVSGPDEFLQEAVLVDVSPAGSGSPRTATYRILAPGGAWYDYHNGTYTVALLGDEVADLAGNYMPAGGLGSFEVSVPNVAPRITSLGGQTDIDEGGQAALTATAVDDDGDGFAYSWDFGDGSPAGSGASVDHVYADDGVYTVTLTVTDDEGAFDQDTLQVTVANLPPVAEDDSKTAIEDTELVFAAADLLANDSDVPADTLSVTAVAATGDTHGTVSLADAQVQYTPDADYNGSASFTYTVADDDGGQTTATVNLTVSAVNDAPSFVAGSDQTVDEDSGVQTSAGWATGLSAGPADEAGQSLSFLVSNDNTALFAVQPAIASDGTLSYTPAANANGSATVTVRVQDDGGTDGGGQDTSASQAFQITLNAVNDAPTADDDVQGTDEDTPLNGTAAGSDIENDPLTFAVVAQASHGNVVMQADGSYVYTPADDYNGPDSFTFRSHDGELYSEPATVSVTAAAVNDAPTADTDAQGTDEDTPLSSSVTGDDIENDPQIGRASCRERVWTVV